MEGAGEGGVLVEACPGLPDLPDWGVRLHLRISQLLYSILPAMLEAPGLASGLWSWLRRWARWARWVRWLVPPLAVLAVLVAAARGALRLARLALMVRLAGWLLPLLAVLVALVAATRALGFLARLARMRALTRDIPGPRLEHVLRLWRARRSKAAVSDLFHDVAREHRECGIFKFWSGPMLIVLLLRADDMEFLLTHKRITEKSSLYRFMGSLMGDGLLHLSGERWRRRRRIVAPYFSPEVLRGFPEVFDARGRVLVSLLGRAGPGGAIDVRPPVGQAVTDMVCHTVMATDMDTRALEGDARGGVSRAMNNGLAIIVYRVFNPWFLNDALFRLSAFYAHFKRAMDLFDAFTLQLLSVKRRERQRQRPAEAAIPPERPAAAARKKPTFLDVMLDSTEGAALSDAELVDEAKTLITAATGGSTDALCFVLLCLSLRQDVQDRVFQEIHEVFGDDKTRSITPEDLRHLEYLERVIKETLRMFPSIPQFGRKLSEDVTIPSGHKLPAGAQVFVFTPAVHMDPQHFPEPHLFDPDRFLGERAAGRHPFAYLPFGAGPHTCIGQRYAMAQIKCTVSLLLRHYRLLPAAVQGTGSTTGVPSTIEDIRTNLLIIQQARGGYRMRLQPR